LRKKLVDFLTRIEQQFYAKLFQGLWLLLLEIVQCNNTIKIFYDLLRNLSDILYFLFSVCLSIRNVFLCRYSENIFIHILNGKTNYPKQTVFPLEKIEEILNPEKENIFLRCRKKD